MTNTLLGIFIARLEQADLVTKTDFDNKLQNRSKRITSNKANPLHYNGVNSYLFVNGTEIYKFKANSIMSKKYFKRLFSR